MKLFVFILSQSLPLVTGISSVTLNHKKIRIGDDTLAWPHERLSFRKIPGGTLSHFTKHSDPKRKSMFHVRWVWSVGGAGY